jgi:hypothetical protein
MDWENEPYVKVYTRETDDDLLLSWEARALWGAMLLKFDRSGLLETKRGPRGVAALVRIPPEVVVRVLPELLEDGRLTEIDRGYFAPNFMAAQEARKSDRLRQREMRVRRADLARSSEIRSESNVDVTNRDGSSRDLDSRHTASRSALLCSASTAERATCDSPAPEPSADSAEEKSASALQTLKTQVDTAAPIANARLAHPRAPDPRIRLNHAAWTYAAGEHAKLRASGIDPTAIAWPLMPVGAAMADLTARTRELTQGDHPDFAEAERVHRRRVDVAVAEAKRDNVRHLRWFTPARFYESGPFWKAAEMSPQQAAARRGPASTDSAPVLRMTHGDSEFADEETA